MKQLHFAPHREGFTSVNNLKTSASNHTANKPFVQVNVKRLSILHKQLHVNASSRRPHIQSTVHGSQSSATGHQHIQFIVLFLFIRTRGILAEGVVVGLMKLKSRTVKDYAMNHISFKQGVQYQKFS